MYLFTLVSGKEERLQRRVRTFPFIHEAPGIDFGEAKGRVYQWEGLGQILVEWREDLPARILAHGAHLVVRLGPSLRIRGHLAVHWI